MRKRLTVGIVAAAIAVAPFAAAPAQASETHLCEVWAPPFDRVFCTIERVICDEPSPPLSICR